MPNLKQFLKNNSISWITSLNSDVNIDLSDYGSSSLNPFKPELEVKLVLMGGAQEIQESGLERWSRMESAEASSEYHLSLPRDCQPPILASNNRQ